MEILKYSNGRIMWDGAVLYHPNGRVAWRNGAAFYLNEQFAYAGNTGWHPNGEIAWNGKKGFDVDGLKLSDYGVALRLSSRIHLLIDKVNVTADIDMGKNRIILKNII